MKLQTLFGIFLCGIVTLEAADYFVSNGTKYYVSYPVEKNWFEAQRYCTFYGMHLITIHSLEENEIVLDVIQRFLAKHNITKTPHIHFYTSGIDLGQAVNDFYWTTTGYPIVYHNWISKGYPTNNPARPDLWENCLLLNGGVEFKWHNINCTNRYGFICQNRITVPEVNRNGDYGQWYSL